MTSLILDLLGMALSSTVGENEVAPILPGVVLPTEDRLESEGEAPSLPAAGGSLAQPGLISELL